MIVRSRFIMLSVLAFSFAAPAAIVVAQDSSEPPPSKEQMEQYSKATAATKPMADQGACLQVCAAKSQACIRAGGKDDPRAVGKRCSALTNSCNAQCVH